MKKAALCLIVAALIFAAGLTGFYIGRGNEEDPVIVSRHPSPTTPVPTGTTAETEPAYPVNINTATAEQLQTLPGIGPTLAQRIVEYREANGPFQSVSELTNVEDIGIKTLEKLLDYITVGGET